MERTREEDEKWLNIVGYTKAGVRGSKVRDVVRPVTFPYSSVLQSNDAPRREVINLPEMLLQTFESCVYIKNIRSEWVSIDFMQFNIKLTTDLILMNTY